MEFWDTDGMIRYSQIDPRWRNVRIDPASPTSTIGRIGCAIAAFGMLIGVTPDEVAKRGHFVASGGSAKVHWVWDQGNRFPGVSLITRQWSRNWGRIVQGAQSGEGVLIEIDYSYHGGYRHWLIARSIQGNSVICTDPNTYPAREVTIQQSQITGSAHYRINSQNMSQKIEFSPQEYTRLVAAMGEAHAKQLQADAQIEPWKLSGQYVARCEGLVERQRRIDELETIISTGEKTDAEVSNRLEQYMNENKTLRDQIAELENQQVKAAQTAAQASKAANMASRLNAPVTKPEYVELVEDWTDRKSEELTKKVDKKIDAAAGFDVPTGQAMPMIEWLSRRIVERATSSRFIAALGSGSYIITENVDTAVKVASLVIIFAVYAITEIFTRYRKK